MHTDRDRVLDDIEADPGEEGPRNFTNSTADSVYDFYNKYIRSADGSTSKVSFTNFTFLIIDGECVKSDPQQCIVCCDAPDYDDPDDDNIRLTRMRVPIETAMWILTPLEQLTMTPSEALTFDGDALCSVPPFTVKQAASDESGDFILATPAEARAAKQRAIVQRPKRHERKLDNERAAVLFRTSMRESKLVAHLYWQGEGLARKLGVNLGYGANPSRPEDVKGPLVGSSSTNEGIQEGGEMR